MLLNLLQSVSFLVLPLVTLAFPDASHVQVASSDGKYIFQSQGKSYLADLNHPRVALSGHCNEAAANGKIIPVTVIYTDERVVQRSHLEDLVTRYAEQDDVFSSAFLEGIYISSNFKGKSSFDQSALEFFAEAKTRFLFVDASSFSYNTNVTGPIISYVKPELAVSKKTAVAQVSLEEVAQKVILSTSSPPITLSGGPWIGQIHKGSVVLSMVYRLYADEYSEFVFGSYQDEADGFKALDVFEPKFGKALIPVPSRIYSWDDGRPLAGQRVAIKDLYDVKGLQTAGGSHAWAAITEVANVSAPSVQQIIDLGGVIVGKFKTAQFASGGSPWEWIDIHYPFNPRGDGYLTCSGSSSGGGCAIAAYEWLDFAIGTDTGGSMRSPAAVSGTYGNRPSQGLMTMEGVLPISEALDTAGVFSRDPIKWIIFAKAWYQTFLRQPISVTGLSPLIVQDTTLFPKRLLYLTDFLPLANPAAEVLLQEFVSNISSVFDLKVEKFNLLSAIESAKTDPPILELPGWVISTDDILDHNGHWDTIARPLIAEWAALQDGRFPPVETTFRSSWHNYSTFNISDSERRSRYDTVLKAKRFATDWFESNILFETEESCSESIMIYDIGMQGLPQYRAESLNNDTGTYWRYLENTEGKSPTQRTEELGRSEICPRFGCVDFTLPIGQVPYKSNVTFVEEMVPVTVNVVARRGCDFVLLNMVEKLVREGILKTVKPGREAF